MSTRILSRTLPRQPRFQARQPGALRFQSTTEKATEKASETTSKAKEGASNAQSKASQGLSRVTSSAGPALSGAAKGMSSALGKVGGRTGRLIQAVQSAIPPTVYYSKVGLELSKLVFQGQKMSPPSVQTFQSYLEPVINLARNPSSITKLTPNASTMTPESMLSRIRNMDRAQLVTGGVVFAEVLGFFTVGEMIGRMKLIGYRGEVHREH
ncbi:MAG: hypothetical protein MMC23_007737 [Stictis urceolatum]|nr:hypothetical protein [Stictis urceolata]